MSEQNTGESKQAGLRKRGLHRVCLYLVYADICVQLQAALQLQLQAALQRAAPPQWHMCRCIKRPAPPPSRTSSDPCVRACLRFMLQRAA